MGTRNVRGPRLDAESQTFLRLQKPTLNRFRSIKNSTTTSAAQTITRRHKNENARAEPIQNEK